MAVSFLRESVVSLEREELLVLRVCRDPEVSLELLELMDPRLVQQPEEGFQIIEYRSLRCIHTNGKYASKVLSQIFFSYHMQQQKQNSLSC